MRKLILIGLAIAACWFASAQANAAELRIPQNRGSWSGPQHWNHRQRRWLRCIWSAGTQH